MELSLEMAGQIMPKERMTTILAAIGIPVWEVKTEGVMTIR